MTRTLVCLPMENILFFVCKSIKVTNKLLVFFVVEMKTYPTGIVPLSIEANDHTIHANDR